MNSSSSVLLFTGHLTPQLIKLLEIHGIAVDTRRLAAPVDLHLSGQYPVLLDQI